jgi:hypothetical protein
VTIVATDGAEKLDAELLAARVKALRDAADCLESHSVALLR